MKRKFALFGVLLFAGISACMPTDNEAESTPINVEAPMTENGSAKIVPVDYSALSKRELETLVAKAWDAGEYDVVMVSSNHAVETHRSAFAQHKLGLMHFYGRGVEKDFDKARSYFESPLLVEDRWTAFRLGQIYSSETYAGYDLEKAKTHLRLASEKGVADASKLLVELD